MRDVIPRLLALLMAGLTAAVPAGASEPLGVFVSILPQRFLVESVGGERVRVEVMVGPGRSPATYEPTPRQMAALAQARLYLRIGVPFEQAWIDRLNDLGDRLTLVDTRRGITLRQVESHLHQGPVRATREAGAGHRGHADPHIWTSPPLLARQARTVAEALVQADPDGESSYRANLAALEERLQALDRELEALLAPHAGRSFMVFHPSWGYLADRYGLRQLPIELAGQSPSARELAGIIDLARAEGIGAVLVQEQFSGGAARTVADAIGARVVQVDPLAEDVIENLRRVGRILAQVLAR